MKKTRGTPRKRKRPAPARPSSRALVPAPKVEILPAPLQTLTGEPVMVAAFVGTLKLTGDQIKALRRPTDEHEIEWRPAVQDGPEIIPYLSHNGYRDRLDAAFGLGGWGMVPVGMPREMTDAVYVPFALVIEGLPRIYAWGEQQKHKMTYGDALEGAKSNAIVRCGKELGIARELWDRKYVAELLAKRGVGGGRSSSSSRSSGYNRQAGEVITDNQRKRLWAIFKKTGRTEAELAVWLASVYQVNDTRKITRRDYDDICKAIEKPGPLELPRNVAALDHD